MLTDRLAFANFRTLTRGRGSLTLCLALCSLLLGVCSNAFAQSFATFDAPGAQGTVAVSINQNGAIIGDYLDARGASHAFLRAPDGIITTFDAPGAGTGLIQGTFALSINQKGAITGYYIDASSVYHGFLRAPDGAFTTFDAPGAGTGLGQGTVALSINRNGAITGSYLDATGNHGFVRTLRGRHHRP